MAFKTYKKWTDEDTRILREGFQTCSLDELARTLDCCVTTVSKHARKLGLKKDNPSGRNYDARAFILMEYDNLTYKEMAERTGLAYNTICRITSELGLRRTNEQKYANLSKSRRELYKSERRRVIWGLDQKTNLKVVSNKERLNLRQKLRRCGYIVIKGDNTIYYTDDLVRRPVREANGEKLGLRFMPLQDNNDPSAMALAE